MHANILSKTGTMSHCGVLERSGGRGGERSHQCAHTCHMHACMSVAATVQNLNKVSISFKPQRMVHIVGSAAETPPKVGQRVAGVTVQRGTAGDMRVMAPSDLGVYNKVAVGRIVQRQVMPLSVSFARCRLALEVLFEGIDAQQAMGGIECLRSEGVPPFPHPSLVAHRFFFNHLLACRAVCCAVCCAVHSVAYRRLNPHHTDADNTLVSV